MTVHANGTDAKDVALYFFKLINKEKATSPEFARAIIQAKSLLKKYSREQVFDAMNWTLVIKREVPIYSLGYYSAYMPMILRDIEIAKQKDIVTEMIDELNKKQQVEVTVDDESTQRNRDKAGAFGVKSRLGEKFNFDMFEGHGEDN